MGSLEHTWCTYVVTMLHVSEWCGWAGGDVNTWFCIAGEVVVGWEGAARNMVRGGLGVLGMEQFFGDGWCSGIWSLESGVVGKLMGQVWRDVEGKNLIQG